MNNLIQQQFDSVDVRFIEDESGKHAFGIVAKDLAEVLEYSDERSMYDLVDNDYTGVVKYPSTVNITGFQNYKVLWEAGVYQALARSNKPKAKPFQKWLYEVVLPSIRKHGGYIEGVSTDQMQQLTELIQQVLVQNVQQKESMQNQQQALSRLEQQNQLLLADKSENEELGELVNTNFAGVSELLRGVMGDIAIQFRELIDTTYKANPYYTLKKLAEIFFADFDHYKIYCKARCNIGGLYKSMTKELLPKDNGNYQFSKYNVVFGLWRLKFCAMEYGYIDNTFNDSLFKKMQDELEDLWNIDSF